MNELYIHATRREISIYVNGSQWDNPEHFTVEEVSNAEKTSVAYCLGTAPNIDLPVNMPFRFKSPVAAISTDPLVVEWMKKDAAHFIALSRQPSANTTTLWTQFDASSKEFFNSISFSASDRKNLIAALESGQFDDGALFESTNHALLLRTQRVFRRMVELIQRETYHFHQREIARYKKAFPMNAPEPYEIVGDISAVYGINAQPVLSEGRGCFVQSDPLTPLVSSYDKAFRQTLMSDGSFMNVQESPEKTRASFATISYLSSPVKRFDIRIHVFNRNNETETSSSAERHGLDAARYMVHPKAQNITVLCDSDNELVKFTQRHDISPSRPVKCRSIKGHGESNLANVYGQMNLMADKLAQLFNRMEFARVEAFDEFQLYITIRRMILQYFPHWKDAEFSSLLTYGTLPQPKPTYL